MMIANRLRMVKGVDSRAHDSQDPLFGMASKKSGHPSGKAMGNFLLPCPGGGKIVVRSGSKSDHSAK